MSVSTQPTARQTSLQRALSSRLSANAVPDIHGVSQGLHKSHRTGLPALERMPLLNPYHSGSILLPVVPQDAACQPFQPHLGCFQGQGLLPPLASEIANQLQAKRRMSPDVEQACCIAVKQPEDSKPESAVSQHGRQLEQRPCLSTPEDACTRLGEHVARLEAEFAAMRAGTDTIADKAAWVAAARQTAHEVTDSPQRILSVHCSISGGLCEHVSRLIFPLKMHRVR